MNLRRTVSTAVAVAVTAPLALLSAAPALADDKPSTAAVQSETGEKKAKPSIAELEKAAKAAQEAYDKAVAAEAELRKTLDHIMSAKTPQDMVAKAAREEAKAAQEAKVVAYKALADAQSALAALDESATAEEKAAAERKVTEAEAAATAAKEKAAAAHAEAKDAGKASDDARVAVARKYSALQNATEEALADKNAAEKALADARKALEEEAKSQNQGGGAKAEDGKAGNEADDGKSEGGKSEGAGPGVEDAEHAEPAEPGKADEAVKEQGGTSGTPVENTTSSGNLAETGSSSALPQIALAGGAAVALGAGAVFVVRRRKAGADA
ncbi:LAETG motif-containing sortase-dependent surface protein [Streptomyces sp. MUM 178J]|uniref:LAETG motif-containing sortase-dependent surface protein n=1 Tax=Streptomyces sp. MUM 178J TaxID=2791991 RepID=UPI0027E25D1A|nr:LAETG motif-containing sortase-dependent surface protein [Streptomyces sp. MUM 178J]WRQ83148.1 LAETG motif-containing sortase-dependent surface protein [Streptomyces sp. MUM 178J]